MNYNLLYKYIKELLSIPSPTGYTEEVEKYIVNFLKSRNINYKIANKGSVIATI